MTESTSTTAGRRVVALALTADGAPCGLGRAPRMAVAAVEDGRIADWRVAETDWDVLHDQGGHGQHHARIVRFMRENGVDVAAAGHMGPPMVNTLDKLGLAVVTGVPSDMDAEQAVLAVVERRRPTWTPSRPSWRSSSVSSRAERPRRDAVGPETRVRAGLRR